MRKRSKYQLLTDILIISAFSSLFWTNLGSCVYLFLNSLDQEVPEYCEILDSDPFEEESKKNGEDKVYELNPGVNKVNSILNTAGSNSYRSNFLCSIFHPEILTPPPQSAIPI